MARLEACLQPYFKELGQLSPSLFAFLELAAGRAPIPGLIPAGPEQLALWRLHRRRTRVIFRSPSAITLRYPLGWKFGTVQAFREFLTTLSLAPGADDSSARAL